MKTKTFSLLAIAMLALASCSSSPRGYQVNGTVADSTLNGKGAYLIDINDESIVDSVVIENSRFSFSGELKEPAVYLLKVGRGGVALMLDNETVVNVADIKSGTPMVASDNKGYNEKADKLIENVTNFSRQAREAYGKMMQEGSMEPAAIMEKINSEYYSKITKAYDETINENKDNILGAFVLAMALDEYNDFEQLDSMIKVVKYADRLSSITQYRDELVHKMATMPGKMFVDFPGKNVDGTPAKLSDYVGKGKYVLVDFWASWCGPCRGEIPNLIELQNKYGGDKFMVLGVNVWDDEASFKRSIEEEGINYSQIYASDNKDTTTLYGIRGIPQIILFAPDGTIVARDLRGNVMKNKVAEVMGE